MGLLYFASNSSINMTVCAGKQIVAMAQLFENKTLKTKLLQLLQLLFLWIIIVFLFHSSDSFAVENTCI